MTDDELKRLRHLRRLAQAGLSEEVWDHIQRMKSPDVSGLDARAAHRRFAALQVVAAGEQFAAIPHIKKMLHDDAPLVHRGAREYVFEIGMHALAVLQGLYRVGAKPLDFGPVRVLRGMPVAEVEQRATAALAGLSEEAKRALFERVDGEIEERVCPPKRDRAIVRSYMVLQHLGLTPSEEQAVDPQTYVTQLQEEIYASQATHAPTAPHLRIGTAEPRRTLGWVSIAATGALRVDVSEHPLAQEARAEIEWLLGRVGDLAHTEQAAAARLEQVATFLRKRGFAVDVTA